MADDNAGAGQSPPLQNEFSWMLGRAGILFRCWTMPIDNPPFKAIPEPDRTSARVFALFAIAALTFAVRGDTLNAADQTKYAALASAIAVTLSIGHRILTNNLKIAVREHTLISTYSSTICVMLFYIFFEISLVGWPEYKAFVGIVGLYLLPAALATITVYVLLLLKARWIDEQPVLRADVMRQAAFVVFGSGVIVWIIARLGNEAFDAALAWLKTMKA